MEGNYPVMFGQETVGKVQVLRQGLYYRFICFCRMTGDVVCRLTVVCGDKRESLGVVVPTGDGFGLDKKVPVKQIGEGELRFSLVPRHEQVQGKFVPLSPEEPFAYIARLKDAFLAHQNGQAGVVIQEKGRVK